MLSYDYWASRFARDPGVVGKKILVNDYPMTIVGVSAAGVRRDSTRRSAPQIRVPILMKPVDDAGLGVAARRRSPRELGPGVRPAEAWLHRESAQAPLQGLFTQVRAYEMTLPAPRTGRRTRASSS